MSRKRSRILTFRTGGVNAAGQKNREGGTFIHQSVVSTRMGSSTLTSGDHGVFGIGSFNTPVFLRSNTTFGLNGVAVGRHPNGHQALIVDGYDVAKVLSSSYKFDIEWCGTDRLDSFGIFAYKFGHDLSSSEPIFTAGAVTNETYLDMKTTPGWVMRRFDTNSRLKNRHITVNVPIPSVPKLTRQLDLAFDTSMAEGDMSQAILDSTAGPVDEAYLHFVAFHITSDSTPTALAANDIVIDITCKQRTRVWKRIAANDMIDEVDDTV